MSAREIAEGLPPRARLALFRGRWAGGLEWNEVVEAARLPSDKVAMSFRTVVQPLLDRKLAHQVRESKYHADTNTWIPALYTLTDLGLAVRAILQEQPND